MPPTRLRSLLKDSRETILIDRRLVATHSSKQDSAPRYSQIKEEVRLRKLGIASNTDSELVARRVDEIGSTAVLGRHWQQGRRVRGRCERESSIGSLVYYLPVVSSLAACTRAECNVRSAGQRGPSEQSTQNTSQVKSWHAAT